MKIGVLMGGISSEREVSLNSGRSMVDALRDTEHEVIEIVINDKRDILNLPDIDFALIALHGKFGEDGAVQSCLDTLGIPYSGCNAVTSGVCMDKNLTKKILKSSGVPLAEWTTVKSVSDTELKKVSGLKYPVFVKPNSGGSSVATFLVEDASSLKSCVEDALKWDTEVMVEEFIRGEEITCPIIDGVVLPTLRIKPKSGFFDFKSKYDSDGADEHVVVYEKDVQDEINRVAKLCWDSMNCSVYARVDMILRDGKPVVLEINTLPGMTQASLFPKSAEAVSMDMTGLLEKIIDLSLKK